MLLTAEKATRHRQRSGQMKSGNPTDRATESFQEASVQDQRL